MATLKKVAKYLTSRAIGKIIQSKARDVLIKNNDL